MRLPVLLSLLLPALAAAPQHTIEYTDGEGDTCQSIANRVWPNEKSALDKLHEINTLGPTPHYLKPGQKLRVPSAAPDAKLTFIRPDVVVRPHELDDFIPTESGRDLYRLDSVSTKREARAELVFKDETLLQMHENALIVVYGPGATPKGGNAKSGAVKLIQGDLRLGLAKLRGEPIGVMTDGAMVSAESRDVVVGVDGSKTSRVSVFDGQATVSAAGKTISLPAGFGTRVEIGRAPEKAQALPPAPEWAEGDLSTITSTNLSEGAPVELLWGRDPAVASWRIEVARDEAFRDGMLERIVTIPSFSGRFKELGPGTYLVRLVAVNKSGLWGAPSKPRTIVVAGFAGSRGRYDPLIGAWKATESAHLQLTATMPLDVFVDGKPASPDVLIDEVGTHEVRVVAKGGRAQASIASFVVEAPRARVLLLKARGLVVATARTFDSDGVTFDLTPEALNLQGKDGTKVAALTKSEPGRFSAKVECVDKCAVELIWNGRVIAEALQAEK